MGFHSIRITHLFRYFGSADKSAAQDLRGRVFTLNYYDLEDLLGTYYTDDPATFTRHALNLLPKAFCEMADDEDYDLLQNATDIQNFYGNKTYKNLMEHLKTLHSTQVQAFVLDELHLYGSSRLGVLKMGLNLVELDEEETITFEAEVDEEYTYRNLGSKFYELSNHLGNVLVTVSDKLVYVEDNGDVAYFLPEITSISDYYPFGTSLKSRSYVSEGYRFGFNGQEKISEIYGEGNAADYGARVLDKRLGRWLSLDKLKRKHASNSNYSFVSNMPTAFVDVGGEDEYYYITIITKTSDGGTVEETKLAKISDKYHIEKVYTSNMYSNDESYDLHYYHIYHKFTFVIEVDGTVNVTGEGTYRAADPAYIKHPALTWLPNTVRDIFGFKAEGEGTTTPGGRRLTSKEGGVSPTKTKAVNAVDATHIDNLLIAMGALSPTAVKNVELTDILKRIGERALRNHKKEELKKCYAYLCHNSACRLSKKENYIKDIKAGEIPRHTAVDKSVGSNEHGSGGARVEVPCKPDVEIEQ